MSSPEAHSSSSHRTDLYQEHRLDPRADEYVADKGNQAYSAELQDGDASPEVTPLDPEAQAEYEAEEQNAREALRNAEGPIRHAYQDQIDQAMGDIQAHKSAETKAKPDLEKNKKKADELDKKIEERQKIVDELRTELDAQNRVGGKYRTSTNKLRWHEEKLRNLMADRQKILFKQEEIEDKVNRAMPNDESRRNASFQGLRGNLQEIDTEIQRRHAIQAKLKNPGTDERTRQTLQEEVDRWPRNEDGELETDEQLRTRLTQEAGDAYGKALETQADREKEGRFSDAFNKITKTHLEHAKLVDDPSADPIERQKAVAELAKVDELRDSLIAPAEREEFKAWVKSKAESEKKADVEASKYKDELMVAQSREKKAKTEEGSALDAINSLAETMKKLSSRGDELTGQLEKLGLQADEITTNLGPVTDPVMRTQLQEAFGKVEKEMTVLKTEQDAVREKIDQAAKSKPGLEEVYEQKKIDSQNAITAAARIQKKINDKIERSYLNKLRVAGL